MTNNSLNKGALYGPFSVYWLCLAAFDVEQLEAFHTQRKLNFNNNNQQKFQKLPDYSDVISNM